MKRNGAKMIKPNGIAMIALLLLVAAGCATVDEPPQTETTEDLGVGYLDPGDSKADGSWGLATTCKPIPERPALQDPYIVVSLKGLTLRLIDRATGFEKVYPVGVGAVNRKPGESTTGRSLSAYPFLRTKQNLFTIDTSKVDPCRIWWTDPETHQKLPVFAGMPFMGFYGGYGIHGPITGYTQANGGYLIRGYVSHGCVRMESDDIREVWAYVKGTRYVQVRLQEEIDRRDDGRAVELEQKWILSECERDADCNFSGGFCKRNAYSGRGFCTARCTKYCDYDKKGYPVTFCVDDPDAPGEGYCTYKSDDQGSWTCRRFDAMSEQQSAPRHNQPTKTANVCIPRGQGWIGDLCYGDGECREGLRCQALGSDQPGLCTTSCSKYCPDLATFSGTFCVTGKGGEGECLARCDSAENGSGCPANFRCEKRPRHNQASVSTYVCVP
ncbi:MAG: L,D-transpeptidase [Myxococcales bacterium]|nr:L,D-transpeptidase [Myxococcales bacterium]